MGCLLLSFAVSSAQSVPPKDARPVSGDPMSLGLTHE